LQQAFVCFSQKTGKEAVLKMSVTGLKMSMKKAAGLL